MTSTNWGNTSVNSSDYSDGSINSTDYNLEVAMILAGDTVVTAGSTEYDVRGLPVGTDLAYSTDWSTA